MLRVFHVIDNLEAGGAQRVLGRLVQDSKARGVAYQVVCLAGRGAFSADLEALIPVTHLNYAKYDLRAVWGLWRLIHRENPQVVQTMLFKANLLGGILVPWVRMPVVVASRSNLDMNTLRPFFPHPLLARLYLWIFFRLLKPCAGIITQTQTDAEPFYRAGFSAERVTVIPNGLEISPYEKLNRSQARQKLRAEWGIPEEAFLVAQVGRLSAEKDPLLLWEAFSKIAAQYPQLYVMWVGEGNLQGVLETAIQATAYLNRALVCGYRDDIPEVLASSDLLALTSRSEAFPNAILEAWASELPVISTACTGPREMIEDRQNGLLIRIGDAEALAEGIEKVILDPDLRQRLASKGAKSVHSDYTLEAMQAAFEAVYRRLAQGITR